MFPLLTQAKTINSGLVTINSIVPASLYLRGLQVGAHLKTLTGLTTGTGVHVVLGMDWQYDHHVVTYARERKIQITIKDKQYTVRFGNYATVRPVHLAACVAEAHSKQNTGESMLLSAKQAVRHMKNRCHSCLLLVSDKKSTSPASGEQPPTLAALNAAFESVVASGDCVLPLEQLKALLEDFDDLFQPLDGLPPERIIAHPIPLIPGATPPYRRPFRLSKEEREEVHKTVAELLRLGWIEPAQSPYGSPVLLVLKKDGGLRMCVDYRALNKLTVKDRFPLPRIDDMLDRIGKNKVFTALDMANAYHQCLIPEEDRLKTAFRALHLQSAPFWSHQCTSYISKTYESDLWGGRPA